MTKVRSDLMKLTVPAPLGGTETFWFCSNAGPDVAARTGMDVIPSMESMTGASAKISEGGFTQRSSRTVTLIDETQNLEDLDTAKTPVYRTQGDLSWWRLFEYAFPNYYRSDVELYSWFDGPAITSLSQAELMFKGYLTDLIFLPNGRVSLKVQDVMDYRDVAVPPPIDDTIVTVLGGFTATARLFPVNDYGGFSDPYRDWESVDWMPPIVKVESEYIALAGKNITFGYLDVATNWLPYSEDIYQWATVGTVTDLSAEKYTGPWGRPNAQRLLASGAYNGVVGFAGQLLAQSQPGNFSTWIRSIDAAGTWAIALYATGAVSELVALFVTPSTTEWTRYDIGTTFTGAVGATDFMAGAVVAAAGASGSVLVAQSQIVNSVATQVYVRTTTFASGGAVEPGRGMFGTTPATHGDALPVSELAIYRDQVTPTDGLHPLVILRDLLNRAYVPEARIDMSTFWREMDFIGSQPEFRRDIEDQRQVSELIDEVRKQGIIDLWASDSGQINVRYPWRPVAPTDTIEVIDEEADILSRSQTWETNKASRITRVFVYYGLKTIGGEPAPGDKPEDFTNVHVIADLSAEGVTGEARREAVFFSRWVYRSSEALSLGGRILGRYKRGARKGKLSIRFGRYPDIKTGDTIQVDTDRGFARALGSGGYATPYDGFFQVMESSFPRSGEPIGLALLEANRRRYAWIGPNSLPSDYDLATEAERRYGFIGDASNLVGTNLEDGYYII